MESGGSPSNKRKRNSTIADSDSNASTPSRTKEIVPQDFNEIHQHLGIVGVLEALRQQHGPRFDSATKAFMAARKSFSEVDYDAVAAYFNLPNEPFEGWGDLSVPQALLPVSVLEERCQRALQSHVSPGSATDLKNEAGTAAYLAGPFQSLICLFGGLLTDRPEQNLPGTTLSSGGRVETEIFCRKELLLFVRELKYNLGVKFSKAVAQVMCELFASWHLNKNHNKDVNPEMLIPVRACLCDAWRTFFVGYDGTKFTKYIQKTLDQSATIEDHVSEILRTSQYTFAILLEGYVNAVELYGKRSAYRGERGDTSEHGSHLPVLTATEPYEPARITRDFARGSTRGWSDALKLAKEAVQCFTRAHMFSSNRVAEMGLQRLQNSLSAWPEKPRERLLLPSTIANLRKAVMTDHQRKLKEDTDLTWKPEVDDDVLIKAALKDLHQQAVEAFWKDVPPPVRQIFELEMPSDPDGPAWSFHVLAYYTAHLTEEKVQKQLKKLASNLPLPFFCMFIELLEESYKECIWII